MTANQQAARSNTNTNHRNQPDSSKLISEAIRRILLDIVIRGHGDRLIGKWSREPEIQQFLERVPYLLDRINQLHLACTRAEAIQLDHVHHYKKHTHHHLHHHHNHHQAPLQHHSITTDDDDARDSWSLGQSSLHDFVCLINGSGGGECPNGGMTADSGDDEHQSSYHWLVRTRDPLGLTPLHKAVLFNNRPIVEYILDRYPDELAPIVGRASASGQRKPRRLIDAQDKYGRTALHYATASLFNGNNNNNNNTNTDQQHIYQFLISKGAADGSIRDFRGKTAHDYARHPGDQLRAKSIIHLASKLNANYQANVLSKTLRAGLWWPVAKQAPTSGANGSAKRQQAGLLAQQDIAGHTDTKTPAHNRASMSVSCGDLVNSGGGGDSAASRAKTVGQLSGCQSSGSLVIDYHRPATAAAAAAAAAPVDLYNNETGADCREQLDDNDEFHDDHAFDHLNDNADDQLVERLCHERDIDNNSSGHGARPNCRRGRVLLPGSASVATTTTNHSMTSIDLQHHHHQQQQSAALVDLDDNLTMTTPNECSTIINKHELESCVKRLISDRRDGQQAVILDERTRQLIKRSLTEGSLDKINQLLVAGYGQALVLQAPITCWNQQCRKYLDTIVPNLLKQVDKLHELIGQNELDQVSEMLTNEPILARINRPYKRAAMNSLHLAVHLNRRSIVNLLIEQFPDLINRRDSQGATCLHWAARSLRNDTIYNWLSEHFGPQLESVRDFRLKSAADCRQQAIKLASFEQLYPDELVIQATQPSVEHSIVRDSSGATKKTPTTKTTRNSAFNQHQTTPTTTQRKLSDSSNICSILNNNQAKENELQMIGVKSNLLARASQQPKYVNNYARGRQTMKSKPISYSSDHHRRHQVSSIAKSGKQTLAAGRREQITNPAAPTVEPRRITSTINHSQQMQVEEGDRKVLAASETTQNEQQQQQQMNHHQPNVSGVDGMQSGLRITLSSPSTSPTTTAAEEDDLVGGGKTVAVGGHDADASETKNQPMARIDGPDQRPAEGQTIGQSQPRKLLDELIVGSIQCNDFKKLDHLLLAGRGSRVLATYRRLLTKQQQQLNGSRPNSSEAPNQPGGHQISPEMRQYLDKHAPELMKSIDLIHELIHKCFAYSTYDDNELNDGNAKQRNRRHQESSVNTNFHKLCNLFERKSLIMARDRFGASAAHVALIRCDKRLLDYLLRRHPEIASAPDEMNWNALHYAAITVATHRRHGDLKITKLISGGGGGDDGDNNSTDDRQSTIRAYWQLDKTCELIYEQLCARYGQELLESRDKFGKTCLDYLNEAATTQAHVQLSLQPSSPNGLIEPKALADCCANYATLLERYNYMIWVRSNNNNNQAEYVKLEGATGRESRDEKVVEFEVEKYGKIVAVAAAADDDEEQQQRLKTQLDETTGHKLAATNSNGVANRLAAADGHDNHAAGDQLATIGGGDHQHRQPHAHPHHHHHHHHHHNLHKHNHSSPLLLPPGASNQLIGVGLPMGDTNNSRHHSSHHRSRRRSNSRSPRHRHNRRRRRRQRHHRNRHDQHQHQHQHQSIVGGVIVPTIIHNDNRDEIETYDIIYRQSQANSPLQMSKNNSFSGSGRSSSSSGSSSGRSSRSRSGSGGSANSCSSASLSLAASSCSSSSSSSSSCDSISAQLDAVGKLASPRGVSRVAAAASPRRSTRAMAKSAGGAILDYDASALRRPIESLASENDFGAAAAGGGGASESDKQFYGSEIDDRAERLSSEFEDRVRREKNELRAKVDQIMREIKLSAKSGKSSRFLASPNNAIQISSQTADQKSPPLNANHEPAPIRHPDDANGGIAPGATKNSSVTSSSSSSSSSTCHSASSSISNNSQKSIGAAGGGGSCSTQVTTPSSSASSAGSGSSTANRRIQTGTSTNQHQRQFMSDSDRPTIVAAEQGEQTVAHNIKALAPEATKKQQQQIDSLGELNYQFTSKNTYGQTYLHFIVSKSQSSSTLYKTLEHANHLIGERDIFYRTARDVAIQFNLTNNVQVLDKYIIDLFITNRTNVLWRLLNQGYTPLIHVSDSDGNDVMLILKLLKLDRMIHQLLQMADFQRWRDELHTFIRHGYSAGVHELIKRHKDLVQAKSVHSRTSLHLAVLFDRVEMLDELIRADASCVQLADNMGRTALHYVFGLNHQKNSEQIRDRLIEFGANIEARDVRMRTPKYYYIFRREIEEIRRIELELN